MRPTRLLVEVKSVDEFRLLTSMKFFIWNPFRIKRDVIVNVCHTQLRVKDPMYLVGMHFI